MVVEGLLSRRSGPAAASAAADRSPLQGASDWSDFIRPYHRQATEGKEDGQTEKPKPRQIDQNLRQTLVKYAELTQVCYDSFYGDQQEAASFGEAFCCILLGPLLSSSCCSCSIGAVVWWLAPS